MTPGVTRALESILLPPGALLLAAAAGLLLRWRWPTTGSLLVWGALLLLYLLSIPAVAVPLITTLEERWPALTAPQLEHPSAQAILVLAGGRKPDAPEYGSDTVSYLSLTRLRYGAWLQQRTGLPVLISGGTVFGAEREPEARLMARVLEQEFRIGTVLTEESSRTTRENALRIRELLRQHDLERIYLVTHAYHMPRAVAAFRTAGVDVVPAPTSFTGGTGWQPGWPQDYLPQSSALNTSYLALREYLGMLWYRIMDGFG